MKWSFIEKIIPLYAKAAGVTLSIGFWGVVFAILIGIVCAFLLYYKVKGFSAIVKMYIELSRNTPLLIQVFFLYFGLPQVGVILSGTTCGIIGLAFLGGSYMAEAFRSGLEAVGRSQIEAGLSVGLGNYDIMKSVVLPQSFSVSMPQISANIIFLLKETSILSAIAIPELLYVTKSVIGLYYRTNEALLLLTICYLLLILPISIVLRLIEKRSRHGEFGN
ncbi:MAG: amino acid ABC transporter permease [Anaerocolumna sp.]